MINHTGSREDVPMKCQQQRTNPRTTALASLFRGYASVCNKFCPDLIKGSGSEKSLLSIVAIRIERSRSTWIVTFYGRARLRPMIDAGVILLNHAALRLLCCQPQVQREALLSCRYSRPFVL